MAHPHTNFFFIVDKPGHDLDGEDTIISAETREEADRVASHRAEAWGCRLRYAGRREGRRYVWDVPEDERPEWAREEVA